jgi:hypothetical protein
MNTITTAGDHQLEVGDSFSIDVPSNTIWNRILFFLLKRKIPCRREIYTVTNVVDEMSVDIKPAILDT